MGGMIVNGSRSRMTRPPSWSMLVSSGRPLARSFRSAARSANCLRRLDVTREEHDPADAPADQIIELRRDRRPVETPHTPSWPQPLQGSWSWNDAKYRAAGPLSHAGPREKTDA